MVTARFVCLLRKSGCVLIAGITRRAETVTDAGLRIFETLLDIIAAKNLAKVSPFKTQ